MLKPPDQVIFESIYKSFKSLKIIKILVILFYSCFTDRNAELTQIAAVGLNSDNLFNSYILPNGPVSKKAQEITGISTKMAGGRRILCLNGLEVQSSNAKDALLQFILWMKTELQKNKSHDKCILVGHNAKSFDMRHITRAFRSYEMIDEMATTINGFGDTLPLFRELYDVSSYSQSNLCKEVLDMSYNYHDAKSDTLALKALLQHSMTQSNPVGLGEFCWSLQTIIQDIDYLDTQAANVKSLVPLYGNPKVISRNMAMKIAGSGLQYGHLRCVFTRSGRDGLTTLLKSKTNNKVRVTARSDIIGSICDHFQKVIESA